MQVQDFNILKNSSILLKNIFDDDMNMDKLIKIVN